MTIWRVKESEFHREIFRRMDHGVLPIALHSCTVFSSALRGFVKVTSAARILRPKGPRSKPLHNACFSFKVVLCKTSCQRHEQTMVDSVPIPFSFGVARLVLACIQSMHRGADCPGLERKDFFLLRTATDPSTLFVSFRCSRLSQMNHVRPLAPREFGKLETGRPILVQTRSCIK